MSARPPLKLPQRTLLAKPVASSSTAPAAAPALRRLRSQELFGGNREILIEHAGANYRMRITSTNKLILTK